MKIGLAAYQFINNNITFNLSQIECGMKSAEGKAELLCFGEAFLQGFDSMNWDYEHDKTIAFSQSSEIIRILCDFTIRYGVDLLLGYLEKEGDRLYSSCMVIENGEIIHNYRRISIGWKYYWITNEHYCEGNDSKDFLYKGRTMRIALCGDLWDAPNSFKTNGILIWPVYVNFSLDEWCKYESEYAQQAQLAASKTLMVNSITRDPECMGGVFYFSNGKIAAKLPYNTEDILFVEV